MGIERLTTTLTKKGALLSVYFTAGFPDLESTLPIITMLEEEGVDLVEIGFPFSDPVADGPVIQESSAGALKNGMTLRKLFEQLTYIRSQISIPLLLMGYLNPVVQFGLEEFCKRASAVGIDGVILPDAPLDWMEGQLGRLLRTADISYVPLITPVTPIERIQRYDALASSFVYAVSGTAVTGGSAQIDAAQKEYLEKVRELNLTHPVLVGFGIDSPERFKTVAQSAQGGIIGTAFIKALQSDSDYLSGGRQFIRSLRTTL